MSQVLGCTRASLESETWFSAPDRMERGRSSRQAFQAKRRSFGLATFLVSGAGTIWGN